MLKRKNKKIIRGREVARSNRPSRFNIRKIIYRLALLVFMAAVSYVLFFSGKLRVTSINISGTDTLKSSEITDAIDAQIDGKYRGMVDKNNLILISAQGIESSLLGQFKIIKSVTISKKFPSTLLVYIAERKLTALLCSSGNCWAVDETGTAFLKVDINDLSGTEKDIPIIQDDSGNPIAEGDLVFDPGSLSYISGIATEMKNDADLDIGKKYETPSRVSGDIRVTTAEGWQVYFNQEVDLAKEVDMLKLVLGTKIDQNSRADLAYVDLRSDDKVFYKFKDGTPEANATAAQNQDNNGNNIFNTTNNNATSNTDSPNSKSKNKKG